MEEETFWLLLLDFSFITSSSLDTSPGEPIFFFFLFFLWRGGSFLGKANMGKMTRSIAMAHKRKPLHLKGKEKWKFYKDIWENTWSYHRTAGMRKRASYLPVSNKPRIILVYVDNSLGVNIKTDKDASKQVASCRSKGSHHIHDG